MSSPASFRPKKENTTVTTTDHLEDLIAAERKKVNERIARLRREAEALQRKVDAKVVTLLRTRQPDLYDTLCDEAHAALADEKSRRSRRARSSASSKPSVPTEPGPSILEPREGVGHLWNG